MGFRFSRRIKILPGVRVNLGLRGASLSLGAPGASVTMGRSGAHANLGLPGTGLSYRSRTGSGPNHRSNAAAAGHVAVPDRLSVRFGPGAAVTLLDEEGFSLSEPERSAAIKAHRLQLLDLLDAQVVEVSQAAAVTLDVHKGTPAPGEGIEPGQAFIPAKPVRPQDPREIDPASPLRRAAEAAWLDYMGALAAWRAAKADHEKNFGATSDAEKVLTAVESRLAVLEWPRETLITCDIAGDGRRLLADIDLPELEHMPVSSLAVNRREATLVEKPLTEASRRRLYRRHVHAILFRVIGEAFAAAPAIREVWIAGYTQRISKATGALDDEYVLSVLVERREWARIAFGNLEAVDPEAALALFECRCASDASGTMRSIEPGF